MKKILSLLILTTFLGCGSISLYKDYGTVKGWGYKEMPPSQVTTSGATFYTIKLTDKSYSVGGYIDDPDATFYYNALWQDLGWSRVSKTKSDGFINKEGDKFTANAGSHRPKAGYLYFHLKRGVAIYFYPEKSWNAYSVTLNTPTEED